MTSHELTYLIDTNVILRYLLDDHPDHSPKALRFMKDVSKGKKKAEILDPVLMECIYVMEKFYKIPRPIIVDRLSRIINFSGIINSNKATLVSALLTYQTQSVDIVDCLLNAYSSPNRVVVSFDKDFEVLKGSWLNI